MNERLISIPLSLSDPNEGSAASANEAYIVTPVGLTVVAVYASPMDDDAGATIDINDDGTGVITGVDASDHDAPGSWKSTHFGGSNDPVYIAADSEISIDANNAANGNRFDVIIWALTDA